MTAVESGRGLADQSADPAAILGWFRRMRTAEPVSHDEQAGVWHLFRYADVARTVDDSSAAFSSDFSSLTPPQEDVDLFIKGNVLRKDPPQHRKLRTLVGKAFTARTAAELEPRIIAISNRLLDEMRERDEIELISEFAYPLPVIVIAELLGIPAEDRSMFRRWADGLVVPENQTGFIPNAQRLRAMGLVMRELNAYCLDHIRSRRAKPTDDLTSRLVAAEVDGQRLDDEEIVGFVGLLLLAGHITTTALLGNAILCLHEHPDAAVALRENPDGLPTAIEEVLRFRTPLAPIMRTTKAPVRVGERVVPADTMVLAWLASANRDERRFPEPDSFDVRRTPNAHLSFGHGIHFCMGAPLARLEARIALAAMLRRWPGMEVGADVQFHDARGIFGARRLPLSIRWA